MNTGEPIYSQNECFTKPIDGKAEQGIIDWQSDYFVVSKKSRNGDGEKGVAGMQLDNRDTSAAPGGGNQMGTKLESLTQRAGRDSRSKFTSLIHLLNEESLKECFWELKRDKSPGIDGITVKEYEDNLEENLKDLITRMKAWKYKPQPVKRVYIPKSDGKRRGLGIPTVEDKLVQLGVKKILEAIYEVDFLEVSYGFRPKRSCHQALAMLDKTLMTKPINYVVDMDIEGFFDNIDHNWLRRALEERINDTNLLRLIVRILKGGIMEEGKLIESDKGTPQGGILSPLLANVYLHYILDLWFEKVVKSELKGYGELIRYADDFIVCFQSGAEAKRFAEKLKERLRKFGLKIAEGKSKIIEFGRYAWQRAQQESKKTATFDFLGFTHYCDKTRRGKFKVGRKTSKSKFRQKVKAMNQWLKSIRNLLKLEEWWKIIKTKLVGHYNYYGISGNLASLKEYCTAVSRLAYKWINRRSQKQSFTYNQYCRYRQYNPLPEPKIYHLTYVLSS